MKLIIYFSALLLAGLAAAAPTTDDDGDDRIIINKEFFPEELVKYTAKHDIVNILLPINALNFEDDDDKGDSDTYLFFVEADIDNGQKIDKGLYVMKNDDVTKLLDNGRDIAGTIDESKSVYFAAQDGIYVYNYVNNKAEKYGTINEDIISIAKVMKRDLIYILTKDHVLYKVTEEGTKKEKVESVVNAQQIILDYESNLYYYTADKQVYNLDLEGAVKKIEGLPSTSYIKILRPPFVLENGVPLVLDNKAYIAYANGTSESTDFEFVVKPTAYEMAATIIQYYAYNKKIYEYNLVSLVLNDVLEDAKEFLDDKKDTIQSLSTKKRSDFISVASTKKTKLN